MTTTHQIELVEFNGVMTPELDVTKIQQGRGPFSDVELDDLEQAAWNLYGDPCILPHGVSHTDLDERGAVLRVHWDNHRNDVDTMGLAQVEGDLVIIANGIRAIAETAGHGLIYSADLMYHFRDWTSVPHDDGAGQFRRNLLTCSGYRWIMAAATEEEIVNAEPTVSRVFQSAGDLYALDHVEGDRSIMHEVEVPVPGFVLLVDTYPI